MRGDEREKELTLDEPRVFFNTAVVCSCADTSSKFFGRLDSYTLCVVSFELRERDERKDSLTYYFSTQG